MDQRRAIQLSHNEISGEDDPATLKLLYNSIQDVGMRLYSALDDKKLELLDDVKPGSLAEANLQFQTVKMVFLPHELEAIEEAWKSVEELLGGVQVTWLADMESYDATLDAIEAASRAHGIKNTATALMVVLEVFTRHLGRPEGRLSQLDGRAEGHTRNCADLRRFGESERTTEGRIYAR